MHSFRIVRRIPFFLLAGLMACTSAAPPQSSPQQTEEQQRAELKRKLDENENYLSGAMWSLSHSSENEKELQQFLETLAFVYPGKPEDKDAPLTKVKTVAEFKSRTVAFLDSPDDVVCATAAVFVGALGDMTYAPRLAAELKSTVKRSSPIDERLCSGRAAMALGLLKAKNYAGDLVPLLQSKNHYERGGAAQGLGLLKATEHAKAVGALLARLHEPRRADAELFDSDDDSAISALLEMGVAAEYAPEFVLILKEQFGGEARRSAMFALARIGDKRYASAIAPLLNEQFEKRHAAIALAVLGDKSYTRQIVGLLKSGDSLDQQDAALALALLNATETTNDIVPLLSAKEDFVRYYAAVALTVLDPQKYSSQIRAVVQPYHAQGYRLHDGDLHHLLSAEYSKLEKRFLDNLKIIEAK
jgi:HEAT repeat protein